MPASHLSSDKDPAHRKKCTLCSTPRDVLVRCQIDETEKWHFVCPGSCWTNVSGGKQDGDAEHPLYRYGGMWKNKHEAVSAKKPKKRKGQQNEDGGVGGGGEDDGEVDGGREAIFAKKAKQGKVKPKPKSKRSANADKPVVKPRDKNVLQWDAEGKCYEVDDHVMFDNQRWVCKLKHESRHDMEPDEDDTHWDSYDYWAAEEY